MKKRLKLASGFAVTAVAAGYFYCYFCPLSQFFPGNAGVEYVTK